MSKKPVLDKIIKILNKADPESNNFEGEISAATDLVKKLMIKHNITQAEIEKHKGISCHHFVEWPAYFGKVPLWLEGLLLVIEKIAIVKAVMQKIPAYPDKRRITFVGNKDNVDIAVEMFERFRGLISDRAQKKADSFKMERVTFLSFHLYSQLNYVANGGVNEQQEAKRRDIIYDSYARGFVASLYARASAPAAGDDPGEKEKHDLIVIDTLDSIQEHLKNKYGIEAPPPATEVSPPPPTDHNAFIDGVKDAEDQELSPLKKLSKDI